MIVEISIITTLAIITFVLIYITYNNSPKNKLVPGDNWSCSEKGCKSDPYGEHGSESSCLGVCSSYVNEGRGCKKVKGVPWNSFSDLKACHRDT